MARRPMIVVTVVIVMVVMVLAVAWYDGGRKELRQIEQPVVLPVAPVESGA